jgi:hypothetical protein
MEPLNFYAEENNVCYVPDDKESLDFVLSTLKEGDFETRTHGERINDYRVEFNHETYQGIALINNKEYEYFQDLDKEKRYKLSELCNIIQKKNYRVNSIIYCLFCRGSIREYEGNYFGNPELPTSKIDELFLMPLPNDLKAEQADQVEEKAKQADQEQKEDFDFTDFINDFGTDYEEEEDKESFGGKNIKKKTAKKKIKKTNKRKKTCRKKRKRTCRKKNLQKLY